MAEEHKKDSKHGKHGDSEKHSEPHVTKLEKEDVQWPGKHNAPRTRRKKRYHEHHREGHRKHPNW